mgnify:CR=1 FL=1
MSDRTDRSERLRRRFDRGDGDAASSERADSDAPSAGGSTADASAAGSSASDGDRVADRGSVKERPSTLMYLPESIDRDLDLTFDEVNLTYRREYDEKLEKNRDYYPLVALYGIDTLREWDADEIREALDRLRGGAGE